MEFAEGGKEQSLNPFIRQLRMSRQRQYRIKLSMSPSECGTLWASKSHTHEGGMVREDNENYSQDYVRDTVFYPC